MKRLLFASVLVFSSILKIVAQAPTITTFSPTSGVVGTTVTITGIGFNTTLANNIVFFGQTKAIVTAGSSTSLMVTVPPGATYQPYITVLDITKGLSASTTLPFNVTFSGLNASTSLDPKVDYTTGKVPISVSIGDLDSDGKPDLAVANISSNTVSVFHNTSISDTISFATKVDYITGTEPWAVNIGDVDGDGKPDLAVANKYSATVSVFRNTSISGTVSFASKVDYETGFWPNSVSIGDVDGDGKPDLAVASEYNSTVSVLRNTSTSVTISFATKVDFRTGTDPNSVSIGDVDGDGKPDLSVANYFSKTVSIFRNTSTSGIVNFATKVDYTTGTDPVSISIGDIDGDAKPDLAVANKGSNTVSIFRNTSTSGTISFATKVDYATGTEPRSVSMGDMDGDGKPDLTVANRLSKTVSFLRNTSISGTVSFATKVDYTTGSFPSSVSIGDVNGDGKPDLAIANSNSYTVSVLRNLPKPITTDIGYQLSENHSSILVYPNPTVNGLTIQSVGKNDVLKSIEVYSAEGILLIKKDNLNISTYQINEFSDYAHGVYLVKVLSEKTQFQKLVTKQ